VILAALLDLHAGRFELKVRTDGYCRKLVKREYQTIPVRVKGVDALFLEYVVLKAAATQYSNDLLRLL
jgi:hypothetical protein